MTNKEILRCIKILAKDDCVNCDRGMCLLTDQRCHVINPNYSTVHDGAVDCDYFLECVLPADWDMNDLVSYAIWYNKDEPEKLPDSMKRSEKYNQPFACGNNSQKYCHTCSHIVKKNQHAVWQQKYIQSNRNK